MEKLVVLGGSGLTGRHLVLRLRRERDPGNTTIHAIVRRRLRYLGNTSASRDEEEQHDDLVRVVEHIVPEFDHLEADHADVFEGASTVFCCLGYGTEAGNFEGVEYRYPLMAARLAERFRVPCFMIVTAMLSNAKSSLDLFRVKGELQDAIKQLELHRVHFVQPALIVGDRDVPRADEECMYSVFKYVSPILEVCIRMPLYNHADDIASAMIELAFFEDDQRERGFFTHRSGKIKQLSKIHRKRLNNG